MHRIFITEEIPSKNKGEAAILIGFLESLKLAKINNIKIGMLSFDKKNNSFGKIGVSLISYVENIDKKRKLTVLLSGSLFFFELFIFALLTKIIKNQSILKLFKRDIWEHYLNSDMFICGHDGLIEGLENDDNKFNKKITYIFTFLQILIINKILNKKVCILASSIGPYRDKLTELLAIRALNVTNLITVRDPKSFDYLKKCNITTNYYHCADFAYLMQSKKPVNFDINKYKKNKQLIFGFTVSNGFHVFLKAINKEHQYKKYLELRAKLINYIIDDHKAKVIFIPHAIKAGKDDRRVAKDILTLVNQKKEFILLEKEHSPEELKYIIGQCDFFMGERTHSNVAATSMNIPTLVLSEPGSHRNSMFEEFMGKDFILEINEDKLDVYVNKINNLIKNRHLLKERIAKTNKIFTKKAIYNAKLFKILINEK